MPADITQLFLAQVGAANPADGATIQPRASRLGDLLTNIAGKYAELARRGNLFHAMTAVTGVAPGTAIGTTAAAALANPRGSGKDVIVLAAFMAYVSGTLGAGQVDWVAHPVPTQAAISGTAMPPINASLGGASPVAAPFTTATVPASGTPFRPFASLSPLLATSVLVPWITVDDVGGAIVIPPGTAASLQATAGAGSSPLVTFGFLWAEVPLLS